MTLLIEVYRIDYKQVKNDSDYKRGYAWAATKFINRPDDIAILAQLVKESKDFGSFNDFDDGIEAAILKIATQFSDEGKPR